MFGIARSFGTTYKAYQGSARQWYADTFKGTLANRFAAAMNSWGVGIRSNNIYNRVVVKALLELCLVGVTNNGDVTSHDGVELLIMHVGLDTEMKEFNVELKSPNEGLIATAKLTLDPVSSLWTGRLI